MTDGVYETGTVLTAKDITLLEQEGYRLYRTKMMDFSIKQRVSPANYEAMICGWYTMQSLLPSTVSHQHRCSCEHGEPCGAVGC